MVIPKIQISAVTRGSGTRPQFGGRKAPLYKCWGFLSASHRIGIGESKYAVVAVDHAAPPARVARQTGVTDWIDVARHDVIADLETGRHIHVKTLMAAAADNRGNRIRRQRGRSLHRGCRTPRRQFVGTDQPGFDEQRFQSVQASVRVVEAAKNSSAGMRSRA